MPLKDLIPTFEVGERVLVHHDNFEWKCPKCGALGGRAVFDAEAVIVANPVLMQGDCCGAIIDIPSGWHTLHLVTGKHAGRFIVVPYTLIEKLDREGKRKEK